MTERLRRIIRSKSRVASTKKNSFVEKRFVSKETREKSIRRQNHSEKFDSTRAKIIRNDSKSFQKFAIFNSFRSCSSVSDRRERFQERFWSICLSRQEKSKRNNKIYNYKVDCLAEENSHFSEETLLINEIENRRDRMSCKEIASYDSSNETFYHHLNESFNHRRDSQTNEDDYLEYR
jgi:hypothetical protein